jgi:PiT family inorganic phosphate transporter
LYLTLTPLFDRLAHRIVTYDVVLRVCLVIVGCYGAYALGANNVANVAGVFVGAGTISPLTASIVGGLSIGLGVATFGRGVMATVGRGIVRLNAFSAFVVVLSEAITVHVYAIIGVPVSTSQAVVGAVLGVGLLKSVETVRLRAVLGILSGWLATPLLAAGCAALIHVLTHLRFVR